MPASDRSMMCTRLQPCQAATLTVGGLVHNQIERGRALKHVLPAHAEAPMGWRTQRQNTLRKQLEQRLRLLCANHAIAVQINALSQPAP
ncbi:hypothetical protein [Pseudomonas sp. BP8]|uniref:hypothetical protein n=1 Tax=Pseudomonas sp. BP8 TaxID=2817864 RepID=UPI001AE4EB8A|nr:hypothetical protein [Pseudomonas sp. BP8]MBP2263056.1 hypothetical protein [Pseudomonas sp. BP8]HDS1736884.1 hypothetical protein [Pseudomonas putida]